MSIKKYINRLEQLDQLIRLKSTGSPKELAQKMNLSERNVYLYINYLKECGAKIEFSRTRNSYVYIENIGFYIGYKPLSLEEAEMTNGGSMNLKNNYKIFSYCKNSTVGTITLAI